MRETQGVRDIAVIKRRADEARDGIFARAARKPELADAIPGGAWLPGALSAAQ